MDRTTGNVKPVAFKLRPAQQERELSFYDTSLMPAAALLERAPEPGQGVLTLRAGELRRLGCRVYSDADMADSEWGHAHVSVVPPSYDVDGQILPELSQAMAAASTWLVAPTKI